MGASKGAAVVKRELRESARETAMKRMSQKPDERDILTQEYERGYSVHHILTSEHWPAVEAIIYRHLKIEDLTRAGRGMSEEGLLNASRRFAIVQGILDDIYTLSEISKRAKERLDEMSPQ